MERKLYIAELEFQLDIQDASVWTPEFQQKLVESIQSAFENINIPEGLELGFLEYLEWDFGTLNSIDQMPFKIQTYLNESWHQFTTADTKTAQTVIHQTTAGVPQFPSETDELDWTTHHGQPQGPQSFFSFPAKNRESMNIPIAFFTQIWKQYVQGQSHIGLGNTMEMLRFLGLSTTLQNRFKSWFIVQPVTQQQQFLKTTFMSMSNSQYENFQYDDWLAFLFQTSFNSDIFAILRLPQKMALKADLLRWLALQKNQTTIRSETITNTPYFDQSNTTTQNRITDSQGKQKTTPTTQNRIANSTNKEISSNQIKNVDASLLNAESDAFWLQNISFEWSNLQAAAVLPLSAHLELLTVWEKTLKSWHTPKTNPFILWFFRQRESFSQPGAFRKIILEILKWTRNSPSESTELVPQDALFEYLNPQLPAAIIFSWEAHITAGEPQTTLPEFWSQFTPFLNNIAIKNAAASSHLDQEHPLYAFTHTNRLETLLSSNFNAYLNPATRKIWQELQLIYEYIQNQYENSETTAAYIHLFLVPNIRTLIETWLQLIQLSEQDRYLSDPINISANQTSENSGDLESDTADVKLQTRTDDALNNQRNLDTGKLEVGPNNNSADGIESQRNLDTDKLKVGPNTDPADALDNQRNLETGTLEVGPNNDSADVLESQRNLDTDTLEVGPNNDPADGIENQRNLETDKLELEAALAERLKLQSQEQLESFQIFQDINPNTDDWNKNALEAWIEWQKSILAETESEQNQPQNLHQRINEFINLWKSTQALGRDRIPTEIGPIQEHHSFSFFLSHIHYQIGTLSQLVQVTLSQHPYVDIAAFENTTKELQKVQNQIRDLQQLQIKNFVSDARSKAWNLELTLLLNQAFVWLYAFESPQLFLRITNEIIIAWNRIYAQSKSQQTASISESNFPINDSNFPINDSNIPINESNFPINESNFPINDSNIPINGIIPIDPLPLPIRDVLSSDNEIFDPFTTPNHIFQGVEMDWRSIDDLLESFEIHLLTVIPSAPKMPNSKWLRWTEQVHPITLTHWYRIEYIKRLLADSKSNATADPIIQLASFSRFIETLLETPFHSFIVPNNIALEVVEDWRNYLSQLVQLRSNLWNTKSTLDGDREWLQLQSETARIRLTENTVESRQRKPLSASSTGGSSYLLERTADSNDNDIDTENRESSESLQSTENLEASESLQSTENLEASDLLKRTADTNDNDIDTENRKSNESLDPSESLQSNESLESSESLQSNENLDSSDPLKRTADSKDNAIDTENRKSNESLDPNESQQSSENLEASNPLKLTADSNDNAIDTENRKSNESPEPNESQQSTENLEASALLKRPVDSNVNAIDTENRKSNESLELSDPLKRTADSNDNAIDAENRKSNKSLELSDPLKLPTDSNVNAIDTENRKSNENHDPNESQQSNESLDSNDLLQRTADSNVNAIDTENRKSNESLELSATIEPNDSTKASVTREASNPLKRTTDYKETSPEANNTENSQTLIEPQSFYSRKVGLNPQQEDRILPFEIQKIAYSDAVKSIYFWLPLLGFETPYLIPADDTSEALVPENEQIKNDSATPFAKTLRNTLEQLRRDPQKHLWYAELRKQKGRAFYQLAEAMSVAEVLQWTNSSYSYQWSFTENDAEKLQQFIRQEFGISATFKFTHYIKYRLILINKPQTRLDMALLLIEEISIRSGGLDFKQAQRLLTLLKGILNLDNAEFNRLQDYYNETLTQQAPKASATTDFKNTPTITWTNIKQPPELGAWFQEFLFERPFISKESLRRQLELWADELFPNISAASKRSHIETWLSQELTRAAQIFRNAIEQKAPLNNPRIQWLIEHLVVYLTHQKTLPLFEEIRTKSQLSWTAITQSLSPQIRHTIAQKVPRIHPVLQQFAQDTIIQIEKQSAPNSLQPIADKAVQVVPLIPTLKPWLNPFTRGSIWFTLKKIISPNTFDPTNKPQRFNNPILRSIETLSAAFRETEMEQDLQQLLLELVAWILPLESQDEIFAARTPLTDDIFEKIQETIARADLDNAQMPQWLQRTLIQPKIWSSQWRRHFFDILEDLNQHNWGNPAETNGISIKNQRLSEAFQRFIWELNSPIYNESPHLGPYWLLSLHQIFDLTLDLPQSEVSSTASATDENTSFLNKEAPSNIPASIDITTDNERLDAEKLLIPNADSTRILAEKTQNEIERLRMTRHVFWDTNELLLTSLWGSFRTALLRQWSEQLKNTVPSETHSINLWTEKWLIPVKGDVTEWILNHSLSPLLRWSKMAGWSANSNFIGVQRMLLLLANPPEMPIRLEQMSTSELALDYEGNTPMEQIQQQLKQVESINVQAVEQRIALTWQREGLSEIAIDTLLSAKGVGLLENPINAGLQLETSPKEQKVNNQVKRDIEKGVRFKTQFCGLMMIAPFYATLFKRLNLMEGQQFISDAHQITAYQVILYITEMDAENTFTEVQDLIPRIIVGLAPERELFLENPLTEESKNEAKRFMGAIKMQWPIMANATLRGFIESFLLRGGLAWKGADDSWNVEVEGMGSDIIMQTLPWGYATMKFPWTGYLIYTTWKAP